MRTVGSDGTSGENRKGNISEYVSCPCAGELIGEMWWPVGESRAWHWRSC